MHDLFISYSRKDADHALQLAAMLRARGFTIWIDLHGIEVATSWSAEIVDAIDQSSGVLLLLSQSSNASPNVAKEVSLAGERVKPIFVIDLEATEVSREMAYHLALSEHFALGATDRLLAALRDRAIEPSHEGTVDVASIATAGVVRKVADHRKALMILPFEDLSPDGDNAWFADGIVNELISSLSNIKSLRLIDWNTSKACRHKGATTSELAAELGVRYFVEGAVRKFGDQLRITAHLLDGESGDFLWQLAEKGIMTDIFELQELVAQKVISGLQLHLTTTERSKVKERGTESEEAYELYLRGREYYDMHLRDSFQRALAFYRQATAIDPNFVQALSNQVNTLAELFLTYERNPQYLEEAEALALHVLELRPDFGPALSGLTRVYRLQRKREKAEAAALEYVRREPQNPSAYSELGTFYGDINKPELAAANLERAIALGSDRIVTYWNLILCYNVLGNRERREYWCEVARPMFERRIRLFPDDESKKVEFANLLRYAGRIDEAKAYLRKIERLTDGMSYYNLACLASMIGDEQEALKLLNGAVGLGFTRLEDFETDPDLDPLRTLPEFGLVLERIKSLTGASLNS